MSNEILVTALLQYTNAAQSIAAQSLSIAGGLFTIAGKNFVEGSMAVPTTAGGTAINVANLASLGWAILKNNDPTNYLEIFNAVSGTKFARLNAGEIALFRFDPSVTAPAVMANTAIVLMQYLILEA